MKLFYTLLAALITMCSLDMLWLGYLAKGYYDRLLSPIINIKFNLWPGIIFYIFYIIGVYIFVLSPGIESRSLPKTLLLAALFGFMCYMTYELSNMATIKGWPLTIAIVDILWGVALTTFVALVAYKVYFL